MTNLRNKIAALIGPAIALFLLIVSTIVIRSELQSYSAEDITQSFEAISVFQFQCAIAFTGLGYLAMTGYDALAFHHLKQPLAYSRIATTSFISNAFSNTIGFALLTGGAIRYRRYARWGVSGGAIAQIIAFANFSFWLGLLTIGSVAFLSMPLPIPAELPLPFSTARPLGVLFLTLALAYLIGSSLIRRPLVLGRHTFYHPTLSTALRQMVISSLDWGMAAAVLYTLLPTEDISYFAFLNTYLLAMAAGVVSSVPGGVGVFETVTILLLKDRVPGDAVIASLLAYRMIYYFLPFGLAAVLFAFQEVSTKSRRSH
ncbi:MAG: lysylphosphatidylglycerol synthase domain-containing protein [Phormidesmis sp.]